VNYVANQEANKAIIKINNTVYSADSFSEFRKAVIEDIADGSLHPSWPFRAVELAKKTHSILVAIIGDVTLADKIIRDSKDYDNFLRRLETSTSETPHRQERHTMLKCAKDLIAVLSAMERCKNIKDNKPEQLNIVDPLEESDKSEKTKKTASSAKSEGADDQK